MEKLLTEKQVADLLACSQAKLRMDRFYGQGLPYTRVGRAIRYTEKDVETFVRKNRINTTRQGDKR